MASTWKNGNQGSLSGEAAFSSVPGHHSPERGEEISTGNEWSQSQGTAFGNEYPVDGGMQAGASYPGGPFEYERGYTDQNTTSAPLVADEAVRPQKSEYTTALPARRSQSQRSGSRWEPVTRGWTLEVVALFSAAAALAAIVILLDKYSEREAPTWTVSLNAVISWISALASTCVALPVASSISQEKWIYFSRNDGRSIEFLKAFQEAPGVFGAVSFLWKLRSRHFAVFGVAAVILTLGFNPFVQNLVRYYQHLKIDEAQPSMLANTTWYNTTGALSSTTYLGGAYSPDPVLVGNVNNALSNLDAKVAWSIPQFSCTSGNCEWPATATLGFSYGCTDVTDKLTTECDEIKICNLTLPGSNLSATYGSGSPRVDPLVMSVLLNTSSLTTRRAEVYDGEYMVLQAIRAVVDPHAYFRGSTSVYSTTTWKATECFLRPTVRSITASVTNNTYHEELLDEWTKINGTRFKCSTGFTMIPENWGAAQGVAEDTVFGMPLASDCALSSYLGEMLSGRIRTMNAGGRTSHSFDTTTENSSPNYLPTSALEAVFFGNFTAPSCATPDDSFACVIGNIARALTKSSQDSVVMASGFADADTTLGTTYVWASFVQIRWAWLSLPIVVWTLGLIMLVGTAVRTHLAQVPLWRGEITPLLFLLHKGDGTVAARGVSAEGMKEEGQMPVRLQRVGPKWYLAP